MLEIVVGFKEAVYLLTFPRSFVKRKKKGQALTVSTILVSGYLRGHLSIIDKRYCRTSDVASLVYACQFLSVNLPTFNIFS